MDGITVKVDGLENIRRALLELPPAIARKHLAKAVAHGAGIVVDAAKLAAPVYTGPVIKGHPPPGTLKKSIKKFYARRRSSRTAICYYVGVVHGKSQQNKKTKDGTVNVDAYYWRFVEFGTLNMPPRPFMRPAFQSSWQTSLDVIRTTLADGLQVETRLLKK